MRFDEVQRVMVDYERLEDALAAAQKYADERQEAYLAGQRDLAEALEQLAAAQKQLAECREALEKKP